MKLGLKQKKILELLSINCRYTNKDIGKAVGLSEDSVAYQIDKLMVHATHLRKSHHNYDYLISILHPLLFGIISEIQSCTNDKTLKKHFLSTCYWVF